MIHPGWRLVPEELTDEMSDEIVQGTRAAISYADADDIWKAALAASPPLPEVGDERSISSDGLLPTTVSAGQGTTALAPERDPVLWPLIDALVNAEAALEMLGHDLDIPEGDFVPVGTCGLQGVRAALARHPEIRKAVEDSYRTPCESCGAPTDNVDEDGVGTCDACSGPLDDGALAPRAEADDATRSAPARSEGIAHE